MILEGTVIFERERFFPTPLWKNFGKWMPFGAFGASVMFGFADALQMRLQALGLLPPQIILMIPYVLTVVVLAGVVGKAVPPSNYKPYVKE